MGSRTIESKTIGNFNIDNDLVYVVNQGDFGYTSDDDTISSATTTDVGGIKIYSSSEAKDGILDDNALTYAVQIESDSNPKAFVHVPWMNSLYMAWLISGDPDGEDIRICCDIDNEKIVGNSIISTLGYIYLDHVNVSKIVSRNHDYLSVGKDNTLLSTTEELSNCIATPLSIEVDRLVKKINDEIEDIDVKHKTDIALLSNDILNLSTALSTDIDNLSDVLSAEIDNLSTSLSNRIYILSTEVIALSDDTYNKQQIRQLSDELSNASYDMFTTRIADYYLKDETSSLEELNAEFSTKQDNLHIVDAFDSTTQYTTTNDIPDVSSVVRFVKDSMSTAAATFRGSYDSLADVPTDGSRYVAGKPDLNDYMFVDLSTDRTGAWRDSLKTLANGTWRFKYVADNWDDSDGGIGGWYEEYLINDSLFTDTLKQAINSGITQYLVSLIMSYSTIKTKLIADCPNVNAKLGNLAYLDSITNNITGKGVNGKLAVFNGTNTITSNDSISPKVETWEFTLLDDSKVTKKVVVSA